MSATTIAPTHAQRSQMMSREDKVRIRAGMAEPIYRRHPEAHAPAIDEIATCQRKELHLLGKVINATTKYTSQGSVYRALSGWKTRNTSMYKGNVDYFDEVRQIAIELCEARANGVPWPVLQTKVVFHAAGEMIEGTGGVVSRAEHEQYVKEQHIRHIKEVEELYAELNATKAALAASDTSAMATELARLKGELAGLREGMSMMKEILRVA